MGTKSYRCTFSLPVDTAKNLSFVAKRMGVSQSAVLANVLDEPLADLAALFRGLPAKPTEADVLRLRGASVDVIRLRVREALDAVGDK